MPKWGEEAEKERKTEQRQRMKKRSKQTVGRSVKCGPLRLDVPGRIGVQ